MNIKSATIAGTLYGHLQMKLPYGHLSMHIDPGADAVTYRWLTSAQERKDGYRHTLAISHTVSGRELYLSSGITAIRAAEIAGQMYRQVREKIKELEAEDILDEERG